MLPGKKNCRQDANESPFLRFPVYLPPSLPPSQYITHSLAVGNRVGEMKIKEAIARGEVVTGEEPFNFFLAVLFPSDQLLCMEYNRVVRDLAGFSVSSFACLDDTYVRPVYPYVPTCLLHVHVRPCLRTTCASRTYYVWIVTYVLLYYLTPLAPQSRFGDNPLKFKVICPQNGTAVLKGLILISHSCLLTYVLLIPVLTPVHSYVRTDAVLIPHPPLRKYVSGTHYALRVFSLRTRTT